MPIDLVTLDQASLHLRLDTTADETDLQLKITAASEAVIAYLGDRADFVLSDGEIEYDSENNPLGVPTQVQQAVLLLLGNFYSGREGDDTFKSLPATVRTLLELAGRTPTLA